MSLTQAYLFLSPFHLSSRCIASKSNYLLWPQYDYILINIQKQMHIQEEKKALALEQQNVTHVIAEPRTIPKIKHIYLEEQNIYGRFIPYLLLKDQLPTEVDSSGNTALHHMCSHNSPYLPLYLTTIKQGDAILNRKNKTGHNPLDVAGMYCHKEYVDMLKEKGAIDSGQVDHWAIQGANLANWSGKVDVEKKYLIHWAAYNDQPQVLTEYARRGANMADPDTNGYAPIDLAVINKSYKSVKVLADMGERPQQKTIANCDSKSIKLLFDRMDRAGWKKQLISYTKLLLTPLALTLCYLLTYSSIVAITALLCLIAWLFVLCRAKQTENFMQDNRTTAFVSQLLLNKQINHNNHLSYLIFLTLLLCAVVETIMLGNISGYVAGVVWWCLVVMGLGLGVNLGVQLYGIGHGLTYEEMFNAHEWEHLWRQVHFIEQRKMVIRNFSNPYDRGFRANFTSYWK